MTKHRSAAALALAAVILILSAIPLLYSCEKRTEQGNLDYQTYPISIYGKLTYDKNEYTVDLNIEDEKNMSAKFDSPSSMRGITFLLKVGVPSVACGDTEIPIPDGNYLISNGVLLIINIFSLNNEHLSGISLEEIDGITYNAAKYSYDRYEVIVYTLKGNEKPVMFSMTTGAHELKFTVLPDKVQN